VVGVAVAGCLVPVLLAVAGVGFGVPGKRADAVLLVTTVAAFALVALTLVVALLAYRSATGRPDLDVDVGFHFSFPNEPVFSCERTAVMGSDRLQVIPYKQTWGQVTLTNRSRYAAKNPGVQIRLRGLFVDGFAVDWADGWSPVSSANQVGVYEVQWDGGADQIVHGRWSRPLPGLNVTGLTSFGGDQPTVIEVTLVADGVVPRRVTLPVAMLDVHDYATYSEARARRLDLERQSP